MKCEAVPEAVSARVDGEIDPDQERDLVDHLERCPACAEEAEALEEVAAETAALLRAREADLSAASAPSRRPSRMFPAAAIAAAILVAFAVYLFLPAPDTGTGESAAPSAAKVRAVKELDRSVAELSEEWDGLKKELHDALLRVREKGVDVKIPKFLSES